MNYNQFFITFACLLIYYIVGIKGTIFTFIVLSMYLTSIIGVGRYSCHCNHASEISLLGICSKCSCVEEVHKKDPNHHCICGAHLISKEPERKDCCSVKYFFLDSDQNSSSRSYIVADNFSPIFKTFEFSGVYTPSVLSPRIKTFQALFHRVTDSLFEKNKQLIL